MQGYKVFDSQEYNIGDYYFSLDYPNIHNLKNNDKFNFCQTAVECFSQKECNETNGYAVVKSGSKYTLRNGIVCCRDLIIVKTLTYSEFLLLITGNSNIQRKDCNYLNGKLHGSYKTWHNNTREIPEKIATYTDGKLHGEYKEWYWNGVLKIDANYIDGKLHGEYKEWHDNKVLKIDTNYVDGKIHGDYKQCHENGKIYNYTIYTDGKLHGSYKTWYEDYGHHCINTTYVNGQIHGLYEEYRRTGEKKYEIEYVNGVYHGRYKRWYGDGNIRHDGTYKDGKLWKMCIYINQNQLYKIIKDPDNNEE